MKALLITVTALLTTIHTPAFAYIDPGSGSAIMSAIVGFFVAIGLAVKTYWYKLKSLFSRTSEPPEEKEKESEENP